MLSIHSSSCFIWLSFPQTHSSINFRQIGQFLSSLVFATKSEDGALLFGNSFILFLFFSLFVFWDNLSWRPCRHWRPPQHARIVNILHNLLGRSLVVLSPNQATMGNVPPVPTGDYCKLRSIVVDFEIDPRLGLMYGRDVRKSSK